MGIREEFDLYTDGNELLAPNPVAPGSVRGSDNGPMFTSEYYIILKKRGLLTDADKRQYARKIGKCLNSEGALCRSPGDTGDEGPDDYYGVLNGCMELGITDIPRGFLKDMLGHFGFLSSNLENRYTGSAFLARQLQLVCAIISASFPSKKNPIHWLVRLAAFPLYLYSALVLLVSCIKAPTSDTDARRLAWHLGNNVGKVSLMNWLAYKVWLKRLCKDYPNGMSGVAEIYYAPHDSTNPYAKYWVT